MSMEFVSCKSCLESVAPARVSHDTMIGICNI